MYQALKSKKKTIAGVGLGYVGLPIVLEFARHFRVIGFDINKTRLEMMRRGEDPSRELEAAAFQSADITFTDEIEELRKANFFVVAVPTDIDEHKVPDLNPLKKASASVGKALKKGALGYICKDISPDELVKAIRTVASGKKYIPSDIAEILSENFGSEELTPTETRILQRIVAGKSNKEIAYDLNISENTVKTHVKNVFEKLQVSDRTSAATLAIKRGLVRIHL